MRTYVYVDAFNLYYGALANSRNKWLDLEKFCDGLLPNFEIVAIKYFTAYVKPTLADPGAPARQRAYLRALKTLPRVKRVTGHFLVEESMLRTVAPPHTRVLVQKENEKGSDVNLATHLIFDAFEDAYDAAWIITGDSDQVCPVTWVREKLKKVVGVINPQSRPSAELNKAATYYRDLRPEFAAKCQFPDSVQTANGGRVFKPSTW
jgi:uncharacterized LabA/DUF88 family protein